MAGSKSDTEVRRLRCAACDLLKDPSEFHVRNNRAKGHASRCKTCERVRQMDKRDATGYGQKHYIENRQRYLDQELTRKYGITREQYLVLLAQQDGKCALCQQPERTLNRRGEVRQLCVDHDHSCCPGSKSCGQCIRGLLCSPCNVGLGCFGDSPQTLSAAVTYISRRAPLRLVIGGDSDSGI